MTESEKRKYVANLYPGKPWRRRVTKMSDEQVTAIYLRHLRDGMIQEPKPDAQDHIDIPPRPPHENEDSF